jgi:Glycosyl transferase family 2
MVGCTYDPPRKDDAEMEPVPSRTLTVVSAAREPKTSASVRFRWWMPGLGVFALAGGLFVYLVSSHGGASSPSVYTPAWWMVTAALHLPYLVILFFLVVGLVERLGFYWRGRAPEPAGQLPAVYPTVCVQLPMFNERAVAQRVIQAASELIWPADGLSVQVLDDSTDEGTRALVEDVCSRVRASTGTNCYVRHRRDRQGFKAGALEEGRTSTDAEFLTIFDADFVPPRDYLLRTIPHFYSASGEPDAGLALVQAQWGHLNHDESFLTRAQSLWVDDHHTHQMSWRSAVWRFVTSRARRVSGGPRLSRLPAAGKQRASSRIAS